MIFGKGNPKQTGEDSDVQNFHTQCQFMRKIQTETSAYSQEKLTCCRFKTRISAPVAGLASFLYSWLPLCYFMMDYSSILESIVDVITHSHLRLPIHLLLLCASAHLALLHLELIVTLAWLLSCIPAVLVFAD
ncbi:uncharacterized protein LOC143815531 [Ranitomeya variabilis]|uniref:uncharacterized protein LOC143815531 n=1 Tax=Ranitomeya variabilis TaxID=490064 RepID=UPI004057CBB7